MDGKDMKIIEILKQDSRLPIKEISKRTKIRPSTVHQRIKNLVKDGVIEKFTIKANNKKIDQNFIVLMLVKGTTTDYLDSKIIHDDHVKEIFGITGEYDMLLKLKFKDVEEFNDFVLKFRKEKKEIQSTMTMIVTANLKEEV
ncbi:MAG TPA: Lrp/AsnC family transcriptional regulator [Candidatus Nanoarchaeia archaeon]|nr:Lrp/AsnC family transcriptional regulator [Candidatus Nanoarchaeia archaeon]